MGVCQSGQQLSSQHEAVLQETGHLTALHSLSFDETMFTNLKCSHFHFDFGFILGPMAG